MKTPREYFETMIRPAYDDWHADRLNERHMRELVQNLSHMADWIFQYLNPRIDPKTKRCKLRKYRKDISAQSFDFSIVQDVADGTKHARLDRPGRKVTDAGQTRKHFYGSVDAVEEIDKLDDWDATATWVVDLDDGTRVFLSPCIQKVVSMWENELAAAGL